MRAESQLIGFTAVDTGGEPTCGDIDDPGFCSGEELIHCLFNGGACDLFRDDEGEDEIGLHGLECCTDLREQIQLMDVDPDDGTEVVPGALPILEHGGEDDGFGGKEPQDPRNIGDEIPWCSHEGCGL